MKTFMDVEYADGRRIKHPATVWMRGSRVYCTAEQVPPGTLSRTIWPISMGGGVVTVECCEFNSYVLGDYVDIECHCDIEV